MAQLQNLEGKQLEVYDLYFNQGLSVSDIAERRQVSYQAINKTIKKLIKKGYIDRGFKQGLKKAMPIMMGGGSRYFRYHNLHFIIEPYYYFDRYNLVKKGFGIPFNRWTATFNKRNIELQLKRHESFDSKDIDECRRLAQDELTETLYKLGDKYGFEVFKDGKCNIKLVNQHMAEVENGIAKSINKKYEVRGDDGKVWLLIDESVKGHIELETVSPELAPDDMKKCDKYLNDWRHKEPPMNSELANLLKQSIEQNLKNEQHLEYYGEHWRTHVLVLQKISDFLDRQGNVEERKRSCIPPLFSSSSSSTPDANKIKYSDSWYDNSIFPRGWFD